MTIRLLLLYVTTVPVVLLIYWQGLAGPLILDDGPQLIPIMTDADTGDWHTNVEKYLLGNSGTLARPVAMLTFLADAAFYGRDSWYWKLSNVMLHCVCGLLVFLLTRQLLLLSGALGGQGGKAVVTVSLLVAFLWLVHPLQVGTVLYTVQRMTILSALFIVLGLLSFVAGVRRQLDGRGGEWLLLVSVLLCFPLAILSKESGALYPVFALLVSRLFIPNRLASMDSVHRVSVRRNIRLYDGFMLLLVVAGLLVLLVFARPLFIDGYDFRPFSLSERLLTEARVVFFYLYQIILPIPGNLGFFHDDFLVSTDLGTPISTLLSVIGLIAGAISLYFMRDRERLVVFGILLFFASQLLESTIIPLELVFEHRTYLGSWGIILALTVLFYRFRYGLMILMGGGLLLAGMTAYRVSFWADPATMYQHMRETHPESPRLNITFADAYTDAGKYSEALGYLSNAKGLGVGLQRLAIVCQRDGRLDGGALLKALRQSQGFLGTYEVEGLITLANKGLDDECYFDRSEYIELLDRVLSLPAKDASTPQKLLLYKAHYQSMRGDFSAAVTTLESSYQADADNPIPLFLMLEWQLEHGQVLAAQATFVRARKLAASNVSRYGEFVQRAEALLHGSQAPIEMGVREGKE